MGFWNWVSLLLTLLGTLFTIWQSYPARIAAKSAKLYRDELLEDRSKWACCIRRVSRLAIYLEILVDTAARALFISICKAQDLIFRKVLSCFIQ